MAHFCYHNRLKQLLSTEEYYCTEEHAPFSFRFHFPRINKSMPIREYRNAEYQEYIRSEENEVCF